MAKRKLYLKITQDKYELPLMVCDSLDELARRDGKNKINVGSLISKKLHKGINTSYTRVEIDDECEE